MIICKRPAPTDDHLQEARPYGWQQQQQQGWPGMTGQKEEKKEKEKKEKEEKEKFLRTDTPIEDSTRGLSGPKKENQIESNQIKLQWHTRLDTKWPTNELVQNTETEKTARSKKEN